MNNNTRKTLFLLTDIQIYQILFENIFDHFSYIFPPCFSPICPAVLQKKKLFAGFTYSLYSSAQKY
jgi:hypothetical protein